MKAEIIIITKMPWYLYLALKNLFPSGRRVSFFGVISIVGVALGVMILLIVQSVMNGLGDEIREKMVDTDGHIRVRSSGIIYEADALEEFLRKQPGVEGVAPYGEGMVMLQFGNRPAFPVIRGVDPNTEEEVPDLSRFLRAGSLATLGDDSIFVSSGLARSMGLYVGATVDLYSPLLMQKLKEDELFLPREVTVDGIFETGWNEIDNNTVLCSLQLMQDLYGLGDGVHGFRIKIGPKASVFNVAANLNAQLRMPLRAITWLESNEDLLFLLRLEKTSMFFVILFIIVVASFSISSSLMLSVFRKTREIGLLTALGGQTWQVGTIFCLQGLIIGASGLILGFAGGVLALTFRESIMQTLMKVTQSREAFLQFYQIAHLPVSYSVWDFIFISIFCLILSTLAGFLPALRAAKLNPAEALRSE